MFEIVCHTFSLVFSLEKLKSHQFNNFAQFTCLVYRNPWLHLTIVLYFTEVVCACSVQMTYALTICYCLHSFFSLCFLQLKCLADKKTVWGHMGGYELRENPEQRDTVRCNYIFS